MKDSTFITRVILKNYKSIAACDVRLGPLMFLVGPNAQVRATFWTRCALSLMPSIHRWTTPYATEAASTMFAAALVGIQTISAFACTSLCLRGLLGTMPFVSVFVHLGGTRFRLKSVFFILSRFFGGEKYFRVKNGKVETSVKVAPAASKDRLYLVNASGLPEFRPIYDAFSRMGFYRLDLAKIRELQTPELGDILKHDGSNLASVFRQLPLSVKRDVEEYLALVVPGMRGVKVKNLGPKETLAFQQDTAGAKHPWWFLANNMSDGTLHILGILVALLQENHDAQKRVRLIGIEEPEMALHPASAAVLLDGIWDSAYKTQTLITSHSP